MMTYKYTKLNSIFTMNAWKQGKFKVADEGKYKGNHQKIFYRSGLEKRWMNFLDRCPFITEWSSETVVVPYLSQVDGKLHRYFIDNYIKLIDGREFLVEIKPKKFCSPPRKNSKNFLTESIEFKRNQSKWTYARKFSEDNNMRFIVITDSSINSQFSDEKILKNIRSILKF